mgnify:CR=1 FL=1
MFKNLFSLALIFSISFNNFGASAVEKLYPKIDCCKDNLGNIADVNCAINALIFNLKETGINQVNLTNIGPNKEYSLYLWTYKSILNFADFMEDSLDDAQSEVRLSNLVNDVGELFGLNPNDAVNILNSWSENTNFKGEQKELLSDFGAVANKRIQMKIYANATKQLSEKVKQKEWMNNDLLLTKFNFNPLNYSVFVEFKKEGFNYNNKTKSKIFDRLSKKLNEIMKKYAIK